MNMFNDPASSLLSMAMILYIAGVIIPVATWKREKASLTIGLLLGFTASLLLGIGSLVALLQGIEPEAVFIGYTDKLSLVFLAIIGFAGAASCIYGLNYMTLYKEIGGYWFYTVMLNSFLSSMVFIVTTDNLLWFVFMWEVMTLTSIVLIGWDYLDRDVMKATKQYLYTMLLLNTIPLVLGVAILYMNYGSYYIDDIRSTLNSDPATLLAALLFYTAFTSKAGLFPLHYWLPDAHPAAPSNVSSLLSGVMIKMGVYGLLRIVFYTLHAPVWLAYILLIQAILSIYWGSFSAIRMNHAKRLLAYSSISHMGYIATPLALGYIAYSMGYSWLAVVFTASSLLYVFAHSLFKTLLFLVAGYYIYASGSALLDKITGVSWSDRVVVLSLVTGLIAISGLPPLLGFTAKFAVFGSLLSSNYWLALVSAVLLITASPLTLLYAIKLGAPALIVDNRISVKGRRLGLSGRIGLLIPVFLIVVFSVIMVIDVFYNAADTLYGVGIHVSLNPLIYVVPPVIYYTPILFIVALLFGLLQGVSDGAGDVVVSRVWSTGYLIPLERHRILPSHLFNELTMTLKPLHDFFHEVYKCIVWNIPLRITSSGLASRLADFTSGVISWIGSVFTRIAYGYSKWSSEFKLDEVIGRFFLSVYKFARSCYRSMVVTPISLLVLAIFMLSIIVLILLLVIGW